MLELATSAMVLFSVFYGTTGASVKPSDIVSPSVPIEIQDSTIVDGMALAAPVKNSDMVEIRVREYFKDTPILAEIARCESEFRHVGSNGEIIRGKINKGDLGVMQINKYYHEGEALKLGLDLQTFQGNMVYAKVLYGKFGTAPWQSSSGCWQKYVLIAKK